MRYVITGVLLSCALFCGTAQKTRKFEMNTHLGTGIMFGEKTVPFFWKLSGHYNIIAGLYAGIGTGVSVYEHAFVPLYADIGYQIRRGYTIQPYLSMAGGYSFALKDQAGGGVSLSPSAGIFWRLSDKIKLQAALVYEYQKISVLLNHTDNFFLKSFWENNAYNTLSLRVGIVF